MIWWLPVAALLLLLGSQPVMAEVGREIYHGRVTSPSLAFLGDGKIPIPLARVACARCHGADGTGRVEGTSAAPAISGSSLRVPTQRRPAYDLQTFEEALTLGKDPAGRTFDTAMPRFKLETSEVQALFRHLAQLLEEQRRGISDTSIRVAVAHDARRATAATVLRDRARVLWERLSFPVIHGRGVEVETVELDLEAADVDRRLRDHGFAALVFPIVTEDRKLLGVAARAGVPVLFPLFPLSGDENRYVVRGISASRDAQKRALLEAIDQAVPIIEVTPPAQARKREQQTILGHPHLTLETTADLPQEFVLLGAPGKVLQRDLRGRTIHGLADDLSTSLVLLLKAGARLQLAEAVVGGDARADRHDVMIASGLAAMAAALVQAGRQVTRASLIEAFDKVHVRGGLGQELDYRRFPLTGTARVAMRRVGFDR